MNKYFKEIPHKTKPHFLGKECETYMANLATIAGIRNNRLPIEEFYKNEFISNDQFGKVKFLTTVLKKVNKITRKRKYSKIHL